MKAGVTLVLFLATDDGGCYNLSSGAGLTLSLCGTNFDATMCLLMLVSLFGTIFVVSKNVIRHSEIKVMWFVHSLLLLRRCRLRS